MTGIRHSPYAPRGGRHERRALEAVEAELAREFWDLLPAHEVHDAVVTAYEDLSWVPRRTYVPRLAAFAARRDLRGRRRLSPRGPANARDLVPGAHLRRPPIGPRR
jgi:hypothetical protein